VTWRPMHVRLLFAVILSIYAAYIESKVGTAETEMDEGKPAAVTARDSETDSEQRAECRIQGKNCRD
jgi:hypothetical protein